MARAGEDRSLGRNRGVGLVACPCRIQHVVNDVQDTVGEEDIGVEELGGVDVDVVSGVEDGDVTAILGGEVRAVGEAGGVDKLVGEEVVVHYLAEFFDCHVGDCGAEVFKGRIVGGEDGYVGGVGECGKLVGGVEGALEGCEVEGCGGPGDVGGGNEERVNDLNHASGKHEILKLD